MSTNFDRYIGLKYKQYGRDFDGVDCFGLVFLIFKNERNIILPDFLEIKFSESNWKYSCENHILENISDNWKKIDLKNVKKYDVHIFYDKFNVASHLGINIGDMKFIHVNINGKSVIGRLSLWHRKLYATIRFIGNKNA